MTKAETVSLETAIEVVLRNGATFETIAGLCKMAVEAQQSKNDFHPDWDTVKAFDDRHNEAAAEIERLTKLCYDYLGELTALRAVGQMRESRQWVGLTDKEIQTIVNMVATGTYQTSDTFARAIEAKLKEKNA